MKFLSIEIANFMAIGEATISLADRGLVLIEGINSYETSADSNGAGKSSIADALSWCLYGVTARGEGGDDIVNDDAKTDCSVRVVVEDGADLYEIVRYRKHKKGKNSLTVRKQETNSYKDLTLGKDALTQVVVDRIIGCSLEVFNGAVYAGQEKMPDLPGMTDKTLKMLIEEASGATLLEVAYVEANTRVRNTAAELSSSSMTVSTIGRHIDDAERSLVNAQTQLADFETRRLADVRSLATDAKGTKSEIDTRTVELALLGDAIDISQKIEKIDRQIAAVAGEQKTERAKADGVANAARALQAAQLTEKSNERHLTLAKKRLAELDHQVGCPCSTCDRPYSAEDIAPAKKIAADAVTGHECDLVDAEAIVATALIAHKQAQSDLDAYRAAMTDLSAVNAQRASLQAQLANIREKEGLLVSAKRELTRMVAEIKRKRDDANPWLAEIARCETTVEDRKKAHHDAQTKEAALTTAFRIAEAIAKVFSPTGVRAFLLDEVTPFLNEQTAKYLGTLSDGHVSATWTTLIKNAKGELREKFSIEVTNVNGGKKFGLVSGGEKRKVRIACALALQDLVARRASKPIELFIGDEIDDALDRSGQERLMTVLEEKARERGSVFIISHADLKDWIRNTVTVKREGPRSTIEEATS